MNTQAFINSSIKVLAICGSLRKGSYTRAALQVALQGAAEYGANVQLIDLRDYNLVFPGMLDERGYPEDVFTLRQTVREAQGIILGTPEYHGSFSGVLKSALDLMSFKEIEGKMIGLVGVAGGALGAVNALNSLRNISRHFHAWVLPQQVSVPRAHKVFDEWGNIQDENIKNRLLDIGRFTAHYAALHINAERSEIYQDLESIAI